MSVDNDNANVTPLFVEFCSGIRKPRGRGRCSRCSTRST